MPVDLEHARQPNALIVGICLDCDNFAQAGAKRFLTKTGHCSTCGSAATIIPNAIRELKRRLHHKRMAEVATKKSHRGKANRRP